MTVEKLQLGSPFCADPGGERHISAGGRMARQRQQAGLSFKRLGPCGMKIA